MATPSRRQTSAKKTTRITLPKSGNEGVTAPPKGGPAPGAMGTGPGATTAGPRLDSASADVYTMPLRPETVTPTAPPPTTEQIKTATGRRPIRVPRRPLLKPKLTTPAP